jgi:hypothetical protein
MMNSIVTYDTLRDSLAIKVSEEVDMVEVCSIAISDPDDQMNSTYIPHTLEEEGSMQAYTLRRVRLINWTAIGCGVSGTILGVKDLFGRHIESTYSLARSETVIEAERGRP